MSDPDPYPSCPNPACTFGRNHDRHPALDMIESNVSGCGFDHMSCRSCDREYYVYYKVDRIVRINPETAEPVEHDPMTCEWEDCPECEEARSQSTCEKCGGTVISAEGAWYHKPGCPNANKSAYGGTE